MYVMEGYTRRIMSDRNEELFEYYILQSSFTIAVRIAQAPLYCSNDRICCGTHVSNPLSLPRHQPHLALTQTVPLHGSSDSPWRCCPSTHLRGLVHPSKVRETPSIGRTSAAYKGYDCYAKVHSGIRYAPPPPDHSLVNDHRAMTCPCYAQRSCYDPASM